MFRKIVLIVFLLLLCFLLGDANPNFLRNHSCYIGESASWSAIFTADEYGVFSENERGLTFHSWNKDLLTVTYKKDPEGLASIKNIRIDYKPEPGSFSGSLSADYSNGPGAQQVYRIQTGSGDTTLLKADAVFTVTVTTDKETETMLLKNPAIS